VQTTDASHIRALASAGRPLIGLLGRSLLVPLRRAAANARTVRRSAARVPDVLDAILVLPTLARQLEAIEFSTATLPEMHAEIARVRGDTVALREIDRTLTEMAGQLERIDENTARVEQLAEVLVPLRGAALRVGRLSERWPQRRAVAEIVPPG
jgi:hypothetical protein